MKELILQDLPNFPEDVIAQWLVPFAETDGWPPIADRWKYLLTNTNLDYWKNFTWTLEEVSFETLKLTREAESQIAGLLEAYVLGVNNIYSQQIGGNGLERFQFQLAFIKKNKQLIRPPVLVNHGKGYDIMDGNHRIAAYFALKQMEKNMQVDEKYEDITAQTTWLAHIYT